MYTSVMLIALSGYLSQAASVPRSSPWTTDYSAAWTQAHAQRKPLALLFGSGHGGWEKLSKDGEIGKEAKRLLESNYVCVYVNTREAAGNQLAKAYEISGGLGIVLSDRTGNLQAFRHEGDLANANLERYLRKYADPERVVLATDSNPGDAPVHSGPARVQSYYPPVQEGMSYYQPSYVPYRRSYGGCSSCR
jgi:hypothetical protein